MPRIKHTVEQIITKLRETRVALSKGQPVAQACRTLGITEQTYYRWRNKYGPEDRSGETAQGVGA
jgi:putative transposase